MSSEYRKFCINCLQPNNCCYCEHVKKFNAHIDFVILIHPIESRKRIATGRMSHLCLENSILIRGHDFTQNARLNEILNDSNRECVILCPGADSINLSSCASLERENLFLENKKLTIIVLDGTWITAKKMLKVSQNLKNLKKICFTPIAPSNFRVRKQPNSNCYSTIEAIHHTIELLADLSGFDGHSRKHDNLLQVFNSMVERQIEFINEYQKTENPSRYRRERERRTSV